MSGLRVRKLNGREARLREPLLDAFDRSLRGQLIRPLETEYDKARRVWNAMIDRHPALIARCADAGDVARAVDFAREQGLLLAVRGGGHNIAGSSTCDGGMVIDLSRMNAVHVDPGRRTARVQGGATIADIDRATQPFGLAVPGGVISSTGVGGLALGGGFGRLSRRYGLTADNLLRAELVAADGTLLSASASEHADLFWGIRGGGGNFGVVTEFLFQLHDIGPEVLFGPIVYPLQEAAAALRHYRDFAATAPRECSVWADFITAPPLPFIPRAVHGTRVLLIAPFYAGDLGEGERVLAPLRACGNPVADAVQRMPYAEAQCAVDDLYTKGWRNYWKAHNFRQLSDGTIDTLVAQAERLPTPQSDILISHVGGAVNDIPPDGTAYPHRDINFVITPGGRWRDPGGDLAAVAWVRECFNTLAAQASGGSYANFIAESRGREREAFGENYARLQVLKTRYDPANLFRLNQNIAPGTGRTGPGDEVDQ